MIEHKNLSLSEQVFERLENDILSGQYARDEVLTELKLVNDLGVSRTPIREALQRLEQEHIVEITPKGIVVIGVTEKDLKDIYEIRLKIEGMAAAETAKRITDDELKQLLETIELQEFYVDKRNAENIKGMDNQFHELVYRFSGSAALYDTLMPLHKKVQKYRRASVENNSRAIESATEHREIYNAIAAHDAKLAEEKTVKHIRNAMAHIIKGENESWD